ncbi:lipoamide acyltransferase component of branched-chain alpha-keto acid dehydrogenase complex, mitochondrial [Ricinus communis]|uniref:Dihydrolipoamide acetyltransferase component of pyruvate dehydrogenase complex n=1 Tax=Ricinus communis TaxID=3988 RepID=B9RT82_RICCO|nr:lipoamide acyltransferase component of branched-chain alpha-keto acid dehydrogenase complex, mitochondrial [Ricinus communis]EEF45565.1 lipoamide acyltransferase component of branched-chain alpha-keto acid dehydrogenase, putative [Ricinus communis]|eukprot:XP_002516951.1 lipoamide acyltransferase component of branched-chain alpha-keto acid dehydrogenase complex, mitochondrial [Ricinus communis]
MITRRFWQRRVWSSGTRSLYPYTRPSSSTPAAVLTERKHQSLLDLSYYASASFTLTNTSVEVRNRYKENRCWFTSHALADVPIGGGVVDVPLAQTGEGIAECELLQWFVQEGDEVEEFQPLCEVQSDKATIEITSRYKGKVAQILYVPGDIVKVGETLLKMAVEESLASIPRVDGLKDTKALDLEQEKSQIGGVLCTPAVRHLAKQYGIDLNDVSGTGKDGKILKEDILNYGIQKGVIEDSPGASNADSGNQLKKGKEKSTCTSAEVGQLYDDKTVPLRGFQRTMVKTMSIAAKVPHFHYVEEINCNALVELKASFQSNNTDPGIKHTFLPLLIKSLSMALSKYPWMNSCFNEEAIEVLLKGSHNIGIAMATPHGLVVPNIKNVQSLSILEITKELARLQQLALDNKLNPEDITGGTISLSNIGAIGGKFGAPIINLPEVAIIAIGRIQKVPQFADDGNVYPASIMTVNIGADHRVLDGATVARFCNEWKQLIEKPELLMLVLR